MCLLFSHFFIICVILNVFIILTFFISLQELKIIKLIKLFFYCLIKALNNCYEILQSHKHFIIIHFAPDIVENVHVLLIKETLYFKDSFIYFFKKFHPMQGNLVLYRLIDNKIFMNY